MKDKKYYYGIDVFKLVCSLLVVSIHTSVLMEIGDPLYSIFHDYITRYAVPFFFISSGFFFSDILHASQTTLEIRAGIKKYAFRLLRPFLLWGSLYFLLSLAETVLLDHTPAADAFIGKLHMLAVESPGGGLWYVQALLWLLLILIITYRNEGQLKWYLSVAAVFYVIQGLWSSSTGPVFPAAHAAYYSVFLSERGFLFYGFYFFLGIVLAQKKEWLSLKLPYCLTALAVLYCGYALLDAAEQTMPVALIKHCTKGGIALTWFLTALNVKNEWVSAGWLRAHSRLMSTIIYFTHFLAIYGMKIVLRVLRLDFVQAAGFHPLFWLPAPCSWYLPFSRDTLPTLSMPR